MLNKKKLKARYLALRHPLLTIVVNFINGEIEVISKTTGDTRKFPYEMNLGLIISTVHKLIGHSENIQHNKFVQQRLF